MGKPLGSRLNQLGYQISLGSPPADPSTLVTTVISETRIDLSWLDNSNNEQGFKIERSADGVTGWSLVGLVGAGVIAYSDTGLTGGSTYYYRVYGYIGSHNSGYTNVASARTIQFLFLDNYNTNDAAPLNSPRTAEPGPGTSITAELQGSLSISNSQLVVTYQDIPVSGQLGLYDSASHARETGIAGLCGDMIITDWSGGGGGIQPVAWDATHSMSTSVFAHRYNFFFDGRVIINTPGSNNIVPKTVTVFSVAYKFAIILRTTGCWYFIKGGVFSSWTLLYISNTSTFTPAYFNFADSIFSATIETHRVVRMPISTGVDWSNDLIYADQTHNHAMTNGENYTHPADCILQFVPTLPPIGEQVLVTFRLQDSSNFWRLEIESNGNIQLVKYVANVRTVVTSTTVAVVTGNIVEIMMSDSDIRVTVNDVQKLTTAVASQFVTNTSGQVVWTSTGGISSMFIYEVTVPAAYATYLDLAFA